MNEIIDWKRREQVSRSGIGSQPFAQEDLAGPRRKDTPFRDGIDLSVIDEHEPMFESCGWWRD
ncbi:MAG: hypothetical protein IPJ30_13730 [Acidobacteria bacterium]|nr:hypothetical protein [Acidobacteriota bacterium]